MTPHTHSVSKDFLAEIIKRRSARSSGFPALVKAAEQRRHFATKLINQRRRSGLSQTSVAARMKTSASVVSKLEAGADVKVSTLQKYCDALGKSLIVQPSSRGASPALAKRAAPKPKKRAVTFSTKTK